VRAWVREQRWVLWQGRFLGVALGSPVLRLATVSGARRICACAMNCRLCPGALCLRVVFDFGSFRVRGSRRADGGSARGRMAAPEPPAEHEAAYYAQPQPQPVARPTEASTKPGAVHNRGHRPTRRVQPCLARRASALGVCHLPGLDSSRPWLCTTADLRKRLLWPAPKRCGLPGAI
jgi:hypothetical protein